METNKPGIRLFITICVFCKRIKRPDREDYSDFIFSDDTSKYDISHGFCPECLEKYYPEHQETTVTGVDQ